MRSLVALGMVVGLGGVASAHVYLMSPMPRNALSLKEGPCGPAAGQPGSSRTTTISTFRPGQVIKVTFRDEFAHTGHYRISFDTDGVNDFKDPIAENDFDNSPSVLKDAILDEAGNKTYEVEVTLPNVECTNCTLQIIQVMTEAAGFDPTRDLYYQCADIVLKADAPLPAGPEPTGSTPPPGSTPQTTNDYEVGDVSACAVSLGREGGLAGLAIFIVGLGLLVASRQRR
jgi:hypothetical protein